MSNARPQHSGRRPFRHHQNPTTLLLVEQLEDRLVPSGAPGNAVPGELLIRFQPGVTHAAVLDFYAGHGLAELRNLDINRADQDEGIKLVATPAKPVAELIAALQQDPRVKYAEPNFVLTVAQVPNDPDFPKNWDLRNPGQTGGTPDADIDADEAWGIATGSSSVVVAVIDTGVDYTHPDLAANMWHNTGEIPGNNIDDDGNGYADDYYGYDFFAHDADPMDEYSHGTHVAGTIGMVGNNAVGSAGVNWNVQIMALKTGGQDGFLSTAALLESYNYVLMMRARGVNIRVVNASYGDTGDFPQAEKDAIDAMDQAGILFVAAATNQAKDNDAIPAYPASHVSPNVIAVAATDANDRYASFTNWGATSVDLAAPGVDVYSTVPGGYAWFNGTSMATPHVTGAAALIWSVYPDLTPEQVKARLLSSVDYIGDIGANASYPTVTNGRLNVRNALVVPPPDNDSIKPAAVGNLAVAAAAPWSVTLHWTATGDNGNTGRAGYYDVRYASAPITAATWDLAGRAVAEPAPRTAGSSESFTVTGLEPGTLYYFAVKVKDNAGNESSLSNVALGNTTAAELLFQDDMEHGASNWIATDLWNRSTYRAFDSATAWYFGRDNKHDYFTGAQHAGDLTLATPLDLSGVSQALLRFREWRQVLDFSPLDVARVQVSRNGADWTTVWQSFESSLDWELRTVDLTPFAGGLVYLRFNFDTDAFGFPPFAITQGREGWYVDDIQVLVPGTQPAGVSVSDVAVTEGNSGTVQAIFTVTRSSGSGNASVHYATANGSATVADGDYQAASGSVSFAPGETRKTVMVLVKGDRLGEPDEGFFLNLTNPSGVVIADGQGKAIILDDEPRIQMTAPIPVFEGNSKTTIDFAVNLSAPSSQTVTVSYATADGTAKAPKDYKSAEGTLTFHPGETRKNIAITIPKNKKAEAIIEAFFVNLSNVSSNAVILRRGVVHIIDDDPPKGTGSASAPATTHAAAAGAAGVEASVAAWSSLAASKLDAALPIGDQGPPPKPSTPAPAAGTRGDKEEDPKAKTKAADRRRVPSAGTESVDVDVLDQVFALLGAKARRP